MARKKHNELAAGIFVILALGVTAGVVIWLGGSSILKPAKQKAVFYAMEQAGSFDLVEGGFVQISDEQIGRLVKIDFDPTSGRTYYITEIERGDIKIHSDGKARVSAGLVGGGRLIVLSRGSEDKPLADREHAIELAGGLDQTMADLGSAVQRINEVIQAELSVSDPEAILNKVHKVIDSLKIAAADMAKTLANIKAETDRQNETAMLAKIHKTIDDANDISANISAQMDVDNKEALMAKVHTSIDDINKMTADARPKVSETLGAARDIAVKFREYTDKDIADILAKLRQSNTEILKITRDFSTVSGQVKQIVVMNRDNIDEMLDNMVHVSINLKAASKEIRRNPWRLLYEPDDKELHSQNISDAARSFANGAAQLDQAVSKLTSLAKAAPEGIAADDPMLISVRQHLQETFDKFHKAEQALWKELNK